MNSFEINKILGAVLGTCLILLAVHIASGAIFSPPVPAKPGYEIAVKEEQPAGQQQAKAAPAAAVRDPAGERFGRARRPDRQAVHDLPQPAGGARPQGRSRSLWRRRTPGRIRVELQILGRAEGQGRHLDVRRTEQVADRSARRRSRHGHDIRRHRQREATRRRHRLSQYAVRSPAAAADGEERGRPRRQSGTQRVGQPPAAAPASPPPAGAAPAQPNAPAPAPKAQ